MSDRLFVNGEVHVGTDFSGVKVKRFSAAASTFDGCDFRNVRWEDCGWGEGTTPTIYRDCVFDGARLQARAPGFARFERCSFRDVRLENWYCNAVEVVDCVFSGRLKTVVFDGSLPEHKVALMGRTTNEFHGNDFSGARFIDVGFRGGIDLTRQQLPDQADLLLVHDARAAVARVEGAINVWDDLDNRARAQGLLRFLHRGIHGGQEQLLLEPDDLRKVFGAAVWERVEPALTSPLP